MQNVSHEPGVSNSRGFVPSPGETFCEQRSRVVQPR